MGIIEDRRRKRAQQEINQTRRDNAYLENLRIENKSVLAVNKYLEESGFMPLLQELVPESTSGAIGCGWLNGSKIFPPERFIIGDYADHKIGLDINVFLGSTITSDGKNTHTRSSRFHVKFYPDGKISIEAGTNGSTTISISDLSQNPTLGESVLEKAYLNPNVYDFVEPTPSGPIF